METVIPKCECGKPGKFYHVDEQFVPIEGRNTYCEDARDMALADGVNPKDMIPIDKEEATNA